MSRKAGQPFSAKGALGLALAVGAGFAVLTLLRQNIAPGEDLSQHQWVEPIIAQSGHPVGGNPTGDITVLVFSDYACAICRISDPELERAAEADGNVRIVYRPWPVFGPPSERAARIAMASDAQGIFPKVNAKLLQTRGLSEADLRQAVERSGGDWAAVEAELASDPAKIDGLLTANHKAAFRLSLKGTPAYLVGRTLLRGKSNEASFERAIAIAREQQEQTPN
jgi:protein-disulfide isomerase